jgi:simple sugar transport system permease protein
MATGGPIALPVLSDLPFIGGALFAQPAPTYLLYGIAPLLGWWLYRTHAGLALRAAGDAPDAAVAAGVPVGRVRTLALIVGNALAGIAGATLVLAQTGTFAEGMSAGRGFVAIAIVALGRWHPGGVVLAAVAFGAASALQYLFQAMGWRVSYHLFLALPYLLTLAALAGVAGRVRAPASLARD